MTDVMDDALGDVDPDDSDEPEVESPLWVCPYDRDGAVCGRDFPTKAGLNAHTMAVHQRTWDGKVVNRSGRKSTTRKPGKDEAPSRAKATRTEQKATKQATAKAGSGHITDSNRSAVYAQSLATIGLVGHVAAGRWFDDYDHAIWQNGVPALANGLDAVGEQNASIRQACDLILAGGGGGAYVQLIMAAMIIAVPIAAHHNVLPKAAGDRFAAMAGVMANQTEVGTGQDTPPPESPAATAPSPPLNRLPMEHWTYDEWREVLFAMPTNETATRVMQDLMSGNVTGGIAVGVPAGMPGTEPMDIPTEEHRGTVGTNGEQASAETEPVSP